MAATTRSASSTFLRGVIRAGRRTRGSRARRSAARITAIVRGPSPRSAARSTPLGTTRTAAGSSPIRAARSARRASETATWVAPGQAVRSRSQGWPAWRPGRYDGSVQARSWCHRTRRGAPARAATARSAEVRARLRFREHTLWAITTSTPPSAAARSSARVATSGANEAGTRPASSWTWRSTTCGWRVSARGTRTNAMRGSREPPRPATMRTRWPASATSRPCWPMTCSTPPTTGGAV